MDKTTVRTRVWDALERTGNARFPYPPHGRIPNFANAAEAADRLAQTTAWNEASTIKCNPDAPQRPVRRRALLEGKVVYMAVPRLREAACFLRLDPATIDDIDSATTIAGSAAAGTQCRPEAVEPIDLVVSGSVAVDTAGNRIGKGEGYSDLEFAVLRAFGLVDDTTPTATTIHALQRIDATPERAPHDVPMEFVVTPERVEHRSHGEKPDGIRWGLLDETDIEEMPVLKDLAENRTT